MSPTRAKQLQWVAGMIAKWKPRLLLDRWTITYDVKDEELNDASLKDSIIHASMDVTPRYTEAHLRIYKSLFHKPLAYRKVTLVHELAHVATHPVREALALAAKRGVISEQRYEDLIEDITEYIAKLMIVAYSKRETKNFHL